MTPSCVISHADLCELLSGCAREIPTAASFLGRKGKRTENRLILLFVSLDIGTAF